MIGYRIKEINGFKWRVVHNCLIPFDLEMPKKMSQFKGVIYTIKTSTFLIRWESKTSQLDAEWWRVIYSGKYSIDLLKKKVRYEIRRGLKSYFYKKVTKNEIINSGYEVYKSSYSRYETHEKMINKDNFIKEIKAMPDDIEFRALYDIETKSMVAFVENIAQFPNCFMSTMWLDPTALKNNAGYVFFHEILDEYINKRLYLSLSDGTRNINHDTGIHDFLRTKYNFQNLPLKLNVSYHPFLYPVVKILFFLRGLFPKNSRVSSLLKLEQFSKKKS
ncbi:hypothetical protein OAD75_03510 [Gammaproteobacteria bacterium]|jgi:hypothetical protein|nr:hypothetical protein [Gammaproteobacteria bacterium]